MLVNGHIDMQVRKKEYVYFCVQLFLFIFKVFIFIFLIWSLFIQYGLKCLITFIIHLLTVQIIS